MSYHNPLPYKGDVDTQKQSKSFPFETALIKNVGIHSEFAEIQGDHITAKNATDKWVIKIPE